MALYYNGDNVSSINFTPQLTLAEYNALSIKPKYWIRTDADESTGIPADEIEYDNSTSGLTSTNVQDAIDEVDGKIDGINTLKTGNLIQGENYSSYVKELFLAEVTEKNGIVNVIVVFSSNAVGVTGGWKEIFKLPNNISKPLTTPKTTCIIVSGENQFNQFRIGTDGSVSLNGNYAISNYANITANITYIV